MLICSNIVGRMLTFGKKLIEERDRGDYELMKELDCEHELGEPEKWMVAAVIFHVIGNISYLNHLFTPI